MQYNKKYVSNSLVNAGRITLREALDSSLSHKEHARQIFIALLTDVATSVWYIASRTDKTASSVCCTYLVPT